MGRVRQVTANIGLSLQGMYIDVHDQKDVPILRERCRAIHISPLHAKWLPLKWVDTSKTRKAEGRVYIEVHERGLTMYCNVYTHFAHKNQ